MCLALANLDGPNLHQLSFAREELVLEFSRSPLGSKINHTNLSSNGCISFYSCRIARDEIEFSTY